MQSKVILLLFTIGTLCLTSCNKNNEETASVETEQIEEKCPQAVKDTLHSQITLKDLKGLIKKDPQDIDSYLGEKCFTKANFGKILYIDEINKANALKIKDVKQGVFFLNKISAIEISQEIVYKLQYSFPIKYLNEYKKDIEKEAKKGRFYRSNTVVTNEDFKITYEVDRWDNQKLKNSYSYQVDTHDGFAKLTIFYSEDLPVD